MSEKSYVCVCSRCGFTIGTGKYVELSRRKDDPDCTGILRELSVEEAESMLAAYSVRRRRP